VRVIVHVPLARPAVDVVASPVDLERTVLMHEFDWRTIGQMWHCDPLAIRQLYHQYVAQGRIPTPQQSVNVNPPAHPQHPPQHHAQHQPSHIHHPSAANPNVVQSHNNNNNGHHNNRQTSPSSSLFLTRKTSRSPPSSPGLAPDSPPVVPPQLLTRAGSLPATDTDAGSETGPSPSEYPLVTTFGASTPISRTSSGVDTFESTSDREDAYEVDVSITQSQLEAAFRNLHSDDLDSSGSPLSSP
jgi:hypothetical protein